MNDVTTTSIPLSETKQAACGLIHDLNNQLLVITCNSGQLLSRTPPADSDHPALAGICDAAMTATSLIRQLREVLLKPGIEQILEGDDHTNQGRPGDCGVETVLLVEDQPDVRLLLRVALESRGYNVLETSHGPDALAAVEHFSGHIHLLVTDMVMPEMSGSELASALRSDFPGLPTLYLSGMMDDPVRDGNSNEAFLQKPFKMPKVRELLDTRQR